MKSKLRKSLVCVISILLCFCCFAPVLVQTAYAATSLDELMEAKEIAQEFADNYHDLAYKDKKMSALQSDIDKYGESVAKARYDEKVVKAYNKYHKGEQIAKSTLKELKDAKNYVDITRELSKSIVDLVENGENADHIENIYNVASTLLKIGCNCLGPVYGTIADAVFTAFESLSAIGESSESELKQLQNHLDEKFDEVDFHLDEVQKDISELSKKTDEQTRELLNALSDALNALNAQQELTKFMSSRDGNFDYTLFKEYLYASANPESDDYSASAYYYKLQDAELNGASDAVVKQCFDNLYKYLNASDNRTERTPVEKLFDYMMKNDYGTESIQYYYFEFLNANQDMLDYEIPAFEALNFTLDLYQTALLADYCIEYCNAYQVLHMQDYDGEYRYYFGTGDNDYITYDDIVATGNAIELREEKLFNQVLADMTSFFRIEDSYTIQTSGGNYYICSNNSTQTFGNVQIGDTIYLNKYISNYCKIFDIDESCFDFAFVYDGRVLDSFDGIYTIDLQNGSAFTGIASYNGVELYSIDFSVGNNDEFNGGSGTSSDPYIISNADQFMLIYDTEDNYKKHYKLSQSIDLNGIKIVPLFDDVYKFEGSFDGNGYSICNFSVSDSENCSLFGYVGSKGIVENVTLSNCKFSLTSGSNDALYIGAISGKNEGLLYNCHLQNCTANLGSDEFSVYLKRETSSPNKYVYSYVGGLVGENKGNIIYCSVDNVTIKGHSKFEYQTNSDSKNKQDLYVGGIVGKNTSGKVESCYVGSNAVMNGYVASIPTDNISSRHPYINMYLGGVVGLSNATVSKVYSDISDGNLRCSTYVENAGWLLGSADKNRVKENKNPYVASYDSNNNANVKAASREETILQMTAITDLTYEFDCGKYSLNRTFYADQVYEYGERSIKLDNLWLKNGEEYLDYSVLGYYGFDTTQTSYLDANGKRTYSDVSDTVKLLVYLDKYRVVTTFDIPVLIQKVQPVDLIIESLPITLTYEYAKVKNGFVPNLGGACFQLLYMDGYREDVTESVTAQKIALDKDTLDGLQNAKFDDQGNLIPKTQKAVVSYGQFEKTFDVAIACIHDWDVTIIENHCEHLGYTLHVCKQCGVVYKDSFSEERLPHNLVVYDEGTIDAIRINGYRGFKDSTCTEKGYSGDLYCTICEKIIEKGEEIDYKNHTFDSNHSSGLSHKCVRCGYEEQHYFQTIEGDTEVQCECIYCHYKNSYTVNSRSAIENLPRIIVSNTYALGDQDKVTVFVELHGNIGITSTFFSIKYPEGVLLDSYSLGNILNTSDVIEFHEYADHLNVQLANKDADTTKSGTLLKLVFVLPEGAKIDDEYTISVAGQKMTAEKEDNTIEFLTFDGTISVVEHLPGDVNGDGVVDLLDAVLIAKYKVTDEKDRGSFVEIMKDTYENFDISYGDVSLDTLKDGTDIVKILRYVVGGYDVQLWPNQFKVLLDYSDFETPQGSIDVSFDNGTGTYGDALIEVERDGYRFDGWYTDRSYKTRVTDSSLVSINRDQLKQTLYAHYTLNKVVFNGNTSTEGDKQNIGYSDYTRYVLDGDYVLIDNGNLAKVSIITFKHGGVSQRDDAITRSHTFLGWATSPDGSVSTDIISKVKLNSNGLIESIDLKNGGYDGLGNISLYAVWSVEEITDYDVDDNTGYYFSIWEGTNSNTWDGKGTYEFTSSETFTAKWHIIKYTIAFDGNGATNGAFMSTESNHTKEYEPSIKTNTFGKNGFTFIGWKDDFGNWHMNNEKIGYIEGVNNGDTITFTAQWELNDQYLDFSLLDDNTYELKLKDSVKTQDIKIEGYLPSLYKEKPVTAIAANAFENCLGLTNIIIPEGITNIGNNAFSGCTGLVEISIPDSIFSIGSNAFQKCSLLQFSQYDNGYYLGNNNNPYVVLFNAKSSEITSCIINTNCRVIYYRAFYLNQNMTSILIPNNIKSIGDIAFYKCNSLSSVTMLYGVKTIGAQAFYYCPNLVSVEIPSSVTTIYGYAFEACKKLNTVSFGGNSELTVIGNAAFEGCESLASIIIPASVTEIGDVAFGRFFTVADTALQTVTFEKGSKLTSIGARAFYDCSKLANINIPKSVKSIGAYAFWACSSLANVTIPSNVTSICEGTFDGCAGLTNISIPSSVTSIGDRAFMGCGLTSITIPDSVTTVGRSVFESCPKLTSVTIGKGITSISNWMFARCTALSSITIPNNITSIGANAFMESGLTSVTIPNSVTSIASEAFERCCLTSVVIPEGVTSLARWAFNGCPNLTNVTIPESVNLQYIAYSNEIFQGCPIENLTISVNSCRWITLVISSTENLKTVVLTGDGIIGNKAFMNCKALTSVTIGNGITSIGVEAFSGCTALTSITIPDSVTTIGEAAFSGCTCEIRWGNNPSVTEFGPQTFINFGGTITIPKSVTTIGYRSFFGSDITSITIPSNVISIEEYAFYDCKYLVTINFVSTSISIANENAFKDCTSLDDATKTTINNILHPSTGPCFTGDSLVTLADGSLARLDSLGAGAYIMSWNAITGTFEPMPISLFWNHGEAMYYVLDLKFSNNKIVHVVTEHGFFDSTLNKYVYIGYENYNDFIGHKFACLSDNGSFEDVELISVECNCKYSSSYSLRTACNDNAIVEGFLTLTHEDIPGLMTYFEFGDNYCYDQAKMEEDIEKYGLYTYEEWAEYVTYEEFIALNGQYLKIAVGKGILTSEDIVALIAGMR